MRTAMKTITWNPKSYQINGRSQFLISGEFHYFRVPKADWPRRLQLFKDAGGNCVATYIPWILHEPVEGDIRFGDIPERDLEGFLALCREMDIFTICRPGPYQYSELKYDGLPGWLCENYPELGALDIHGKPFRKASVSYLHPVFLAKAKRWFDAVCPIIARYSLSRGGPVAFVQFDNELAGVHVWFGGGWDYHPETMGFGTENGRYPNFLRAKYENIGQLNQCYGTNYEEFKDVRPFSGSSPDKPEEYRRVKDYQDFYFATIAEYSALLAGWMRNSGIDCDLVHNSANPNMNPYFLETAARLKPNFILGSDHYYNLDLDWESNNPTPKYAVKVFYSNEMLRLMDYPATVFELPGGSCSDWPPVTPEDVKCCYLLNVALGMKGLNYYIFTGGPNPLNTGANGDSYDYGAGVGADGAIRPLYLTQKEFGAFLQKNSWLAEAEKVSDLNIGLDWEHSRSRSFNSSQSPAQFSNADAWTFLQKGLMITAFCSSYSPSLLDLRDDSLVQTVDKPLIIATSDCMAASIQKRLIDFVKNGGKLLLVPAIPNQDENLNPCTILRDFLGATVEPCLETFSRVNAGPVQNVPANVRLFMCQKLPEGAESLAVEETSGAIISWRKRFPGGGMVIWLGLCWKYTRYEHSRLFKYLLGEMQWDSPVVDCDNPNVWTSLRSDGKRSMLFMMNLFSAPMGAGVKVKASDGEYRDLGRFELRPMEVRTVDVKL
jgi:beta-galactosidase